MALVYKDMTLKDIVKWCKENNQEDWLLAETAKKIEVERYTKRVKTTNASGKTVWVADKNTPKTKTQASITFIQLKKTFVEKFMPEIAPKPKTSVSLHDKVVALLKEI